MTKARELAELGDVVTVDDANVGVGGAPVASASNYNGAALHLRQANSSSAGSQIHLTTGASGHAAADGSFIAQWSDNDLYVTNQESAGEIKFSTGGSQKVAIDSSGNVGINQTSPSSYSSSADNLVVGSSGSNGITIASGTSNSGNINFADGTSGSDRLRGYIQYQHNTNNLVLGADADDRVVIFSTGNTSFATTTDLGGSIGVVTTSGNWAMRVRDSESNDAFIRFDNSSGTQVGGITRSGSSTVYATSSDHRLKENLADITDGITRLKQLDPKRFNFIGNADTIVDGFIAHEVQTVVPEAITGTHNEVDSEGEPVYQGIDQSKLVPLLTAALQEAVAKIETLETKVAALEAE